MLSCSTACRIFPDQGSSPPGSSVHGLLQARILEWVAVPSPGDRPNPGIEPSSPALQEDSLPSEPQGKPQRSKYLTSGLRGTGYKLITWVWPKRCSYGCQICTPTPKRITVPFPEVSWKEWVNDLHLLTCLTTSHTLFQCRGGRWRIQGTTHIVDLGQSFCPLQASLSSRGTATDSLISTESLKE